jgi:Protein of unknown function (DUF3306)
MVEESRGFLGRWARRKTDALQGTPLAEPVVPVKTGAVPGMSAGLEASTLVEIAPVAAPPSGDAAADAENLPELPKKPALSLDDVKLLTKDSDFKPFMTSDVGPEVRNAAMRKLFADPHFNVMDGLDIYIDDYSISDPIPESMLRQMASAKFLKLFDDEEDENGKDGEAGEESGTVAAKEDPAPRESANVTYAQSVAKSHEPPDLPGQDPRISPPFQPSRANA